MNLEEKLEDKYVAFLDVLGFSDMIFKNNLDQLNKYFEVIEETLVAIRADKENIESLIISDSVILVAPNDKDQFRLLVRAVQTIQAALVRHNIWLRGGISYGKVYFDMNKGQVVGKGFIKAYLLESEAKAPRVIIDSSLVTQIGEDKHTFMNFMNMNDFGTLQENCPLVADVIEGIEHDFFFVSYANRLMEDAIEQNFLEEIYLVVKKNLYGSTKHYQKYLWVKKYFRAVLFGYYMNHRSKIEEETTIKDFDDEMLNWNKL